MLKHQGLLIGNNDLLIASHARSIDAVLVTNNTKEFSRVPDLTLEGWIESLRLNNRQALARPKARS